MARQVRGWMTWHLLSWLSQRSGKFRPNLALFWEGADHSCGSNRNFLYSWGRTVAGGGHRPPVLPSDPWRQSLVQSCRQKDRRPQCQWPQKVTSAQGSSQRYRAYDGETKQGNQEAWQWPRTEGKGRIGMTLGLVLVPRTQPWSSGHRKRVMPSLSLRPGASLVLREAELSPGFRPQERSPPTCCRAHLRPPSHLRQRPDFLRPLHYSVWLFQRRQKRDLIL